MEFQIPYTTDAERATATGPVDFDKLGEVIDGYEPDWRPIRAGEDVGHLTASLEASEALIKRMEAQLALSARGSGGDSRADRRRIAAPADRPRPDQGQGTSSAPAGGKVRAADVKPATLHALASAAVAQPER
jgi:hypothetical protein